MDEKVADKLCCPACAASAKRRYPMNERLDESGGEYLLCAKCGKKFTCSKGIYDLTLEESRDTSLSQRAMEFRPLVSIYEKIWRPLITMPFSNLSWEMEMSFFFLNLSDGSHVLDLACGTGNFTRLFAKKVKNGVMVGMDLSKPMLEKGMKIIEKKNVSGITLIRGDVTRWPFAQKSFDRVHCSGGLHLFPDIQSVFNSIAGTLVQGGIFVGATYIKRGSAAGGKIKDLFERASGFHWFHPDELKEISKKAGLTEWNSVVNKQGIVFSVRKTG
jgi:SAM-dependent methyltransferase